MIPPRGCAYVVMVHRQDAHTALNKLNRGTVKVNQKSIKVTFFNCQECSVFDMLSSSDFSFCKQQLCNTALQRQRDFSHSRMLFSPNLSIVELNSCVTRQVIGLRCKILITSPHGNIVGLDLCMRALFDLSFSIRSRGRWIRALNRSLRSFGMWSGVSHISPGTKWNLTIFRVIEEVACWTLKHSNQVRSHFTVNLKLLILQSFLYIVFVIIDLYNVLNIAEVV